VAFLLSGSTPRGSSVTVNVLAAAARQSWRILLWQALWIVALATIFALTLGTRFAVSALVGGGIGLVWTVYMALVLFKHSLTHGLRMSALSFFAGWLFKVVVTVSLLVAVLRSRMFVPLAVLAGLFGAMVAYWAWFVFGKKYASDADGK
jgi:F0F1-type ATP synthase assembly protein I